MRANGSYVGRGAPEIDVFEALVDGVGGKVLNSFARFGGDWSKLSGISIGTMGAV